MNPATSSKRPAIKRSVVKRSAVKRNGHSVPASPAQTLTVTVDVPSGSSLDEPTAQRLLTLALVSSGHLSQSQAAGSLGISRYDLIELMGAHSLPIVRLDAEEAVTESRNLQELQELRNRRKTALKAAHP